MLVEDVPAVELEDALKVVIPALGLERCREWKSDSDPHSSNPPALHDMSGSEPESHLPRIGYAVWLDVELEEEDCFESGA